MKDSNKSVVITGASTGIGRACTLHMDRLGWRVFAGIRNESDAAWLRKECSPLLSTLFLDVTNLESVEAAAQVVDEAVGESGLTGLINNAGIPYGGPVEFLDLDKVRALFEVNFFGVISVTQAFLPLLRLGRGRILNVSSINGLISAPFISPYSSGKFALEALSDSMRIELHPWGIDVALLEPGAIATPIWDKGADVLKSLLEQTPPKKFRLYGTVVARLEGLFRQHGIPPGEVAKAAAHALTSHRPKTRYVIGPDAVLIFFLKHLPDRLRDRIILSQLPAWGGVNDD